MRGYSPHECHIINDIQSDSEEVMGRRKNTINIERDRNDWVGDWVKTLMFSGYTREDFNNNINGVKEMVKKEVERMLVVKWGGDAVDYFFNGKVFKK